MLRRRSLLLSPLSLATACGSWPTAPTAPTAPAVAPPEPWQEVRLPGKSPTRYAMSRLEGREVIHARADASASMWRRRVDVPARGFRELRFTWRVDRLNPRADVGDVEHEDAVARVLLAFDGDHDRLSARTRAQFELARALTGEAPPYATLMYVWETARPVESLVVNPRSDRVRKIVVDSGAEHLGRWREHRRDLAADFRRAFGEDPGPLLGVAVMTDADNTRSKAEAWYGPIRLGDTT